VRDRLDRGKAYLDRSFPQLDRIVSASIMGDDAASRTTK
jgi:hypothetical protein